MKTEQCNIFCKSFCSLCSDIKQVMGELSEQFFSHTIKLKKINEPTNGNSTTATTTQEKTKITGTYVLCGACQELYES